MPHLQTLSLTLTHPIRPHQISRWRGAFLEMIGWEDELFHNHKNEGYTGNGTYTTQHAKGKPQHYRYPLIQYYEQNRQATILGINEGRDALLKVLDQQELKIRWDGREQLLKIVKVQKGEHHFEMLPQPKRYRLQQWLALTQKNHQEWEKATSLMERVKLLERLLPNHLIALFKNFQWNWPERLETQILLLHHMHPIRFKGTSMFTFDISFTANVALPIGIGIGKGVSHGFGTLQLVDGREKEQNRRRRIRR